MYQQTFGDIEYSNRRRITRREKFLAIMDAIIPWAEWIAMIQPYYYANTRGRKPKDIEVMLRMYLMQDWFNLSDEGIEEAIYDSYAMRRFLGINFSEEQVPDATTLLKFRHLLEENHLGEEFFKAINRVMEATGHIMHGGTIVDATIISAFEPITAVVVGIALLGEPAQRTASIGIVLVIVSVVIMTWVTEHKSKVSS